MTKASGIGVAAGGVTSGASNPWCDYVLSHDEGGASPSSHDVAFPFHMANLRRRPTLDVCVVGHCNLNCVSCSYFSPLSGREFLSLADYGRSLALLAQIEGVEEFFDAICLMGGEPLLHPGLADFVRATRKHLPRIAIRVVTNGTLLEQAPDELWEALSSAQAKLLITPYPVGVDHERLVAQAAVKGVRATLGGGLAKDENGRAYFLRTPLDPNGACEPTEAFVSCPMGGVIMQLRDGRIYPCATGALLERLNERFGTCFERGEEDSLDVASIKSAEEIDAFRRRPKSICRYCAQALTTRVAWGTSERVWGEWLVGGTECG